MRFEKHVNFKPLGLGPHLLRMWSQHMEHVLAWNRATVGLLGTRVVVERFFLPPSLPSFLHSSNIYIVDCVPGTLPWATDLAVNTAVPALVELTV